MDLTHMNFHDKMVELARRQDEVALTTVDGTVYSIAYVTATPTFTGVIGGYTTLTGDDSSPTEAPAQVTTTDSAPAVATVSSSPTVESSAETTPTSASLIAPTTLVSTTSAGIIGSTNTGSVAAASASASSSADSTSSSSSGLSTGAKAGLAIGIIAIVGLFAVFLLWLLGKKKRQIEANTGSDNEKYDPPAGVNSTEMATRSPPISATAPRISLRPVSRMLPEFVGASSKSRLSAGNMLTTIGESDSASTRKTPSPQPRGPSPTPARGLGLAAATQSSQDNNPNNPFADPQNPFADPEKLSIQAPAPLALAPSVARSPPVAPIASGVIGDAGALSAPAATTKPTPTPAPMPAPAQAAVPVPAPVQAPAPVMMPAAVPAPVPAPQLAQQVTASPASSAPASPALVAAAGQGSEAPRPDASQGNVYRVLMDFAPSMEDELELKSGQLVRMLHEYDDGWALCIRLDRSQQGVVPRTCLAAKPSKPKPSHLNQYARPTPGGPGSRPMSPAGGPQRPMSPAGRSMSPMGRPMSPAGRPMSPAGMRRPMSPGFNQAPRGMSPGPRAGPSGRSMSPGPRAGPRAGPPGRSMSPGPYGGRNGPPPMAAVGRPRSNSASNVRDKRNSPVGPSKLRPGMAM